MNNRSMNSNIINVNSSKRDRTILGLIHSPDQGSDIRENGKNNVFAIVPQQVK